MIFKNMVELLGISIEEAEPAMYATFEKLEADISRKKEPWAYLWENKESLGKYIKRLKELLNSEQNPERSVATDDDSSKKVDNQKQKAMTKEIDKKAILKKAMNRKYCSRTRFDYLDEEELPMIYNAMEEYHRLASIETEGEIRLLEEREEEEIDRLKGLIWKLWELKFYVTAPLSVHEGVMDELYKRQKEQFKTENNL